MLQTQVLKFEREQPHTINPVRDSDRFFGPGQEFRDVQFADRALHALQRISEIALDQPFFVGVGFHQPHEPYYFPSEYWDIYETWENISMYPRTPLPPRDSPIWALGDVQRGLNLLNKTRYCRTNISTNIDCEVVINQFELFKNELFPNREDNFPRRTPMPFAVHQELLRGYSASVSFMDNQVYKFHPDIRCYLFISNTDRLAVCWTS